MIRIWLSKGAEKAPSGYELAHNTSEAIILFLRDKVDELHIDLTSFDLYDIELGPLRDWLKNNKKLPNIITFYPSRTGFSKGVSSTGTISPYKSIDDFWRETTKLFERMMHPELT